MATADPPSTCPPPPFPHQAGSDALLTAATFRKLHRVYFEGGLAVEKYAGVLYGLGSDGEEPAPT